MLKITDNQDRWHFLALTSIPTDNAYLRSTKSFSNLINSISSKNHDDFYSYGCFHSFRKESTLQKHIELCKNNKFCPVELSKPHKNFKYYKPG